jgi:hypothetical protein
MPCVSQIVDAAQGNGAGTALACLPGAWSASPQGVTVTRSEDSANDQRPPDRSSVVYLASLTWLAVYIGLAMLISLVIHVTVTMPLGFSAKSDRVFAALALASGLMADFALRRAGRRKLVVSEKLKWPVSYVWVPLCLYVFLFEPLK